MKRVLSILNDIAHDLVLLVLVAIPYCTGLLLLFWAQTMVELLSDKSIDVKVVVR